jgi:hypothetical protein
MTADPAYLAGCHNKHRYPGRHVAEQVAKRMRRRHPGEAITAYPCRFCRRWHVGEPRMLA